MRAKYAQAHGMKGAAPYILCLLTHKLRKAGLHLVCRLVCERDGQYIPRRTGGGRKA